MTTPDRTLRTIPTGERKYPVEPFVDEEFNEAIMSLKEKKKTPRPVDIHAKVI